MTKLVVDRGSGEPRFDRDHTLYVLRHNLGKADAFITAAEEPYRARRRCVVRRRRSRDVVRVRVPTDQAPLFHVPGSHGGWYISLLFGHGCSIEVPMQGLRKLLAGSRGEVIVARRLTGAEARFLEPRRADCDADAHAWLVPKEEEQFRRPRGGESAKLAVQEPSSASDELDKHSGGA